MMRKALLTAGLLLVALVLAAACNAPASEPPASSTQGASPTATEKPAPASAAATPTTAAGNPAGQGTSTPMPGMAMTENKPKAAMMMQEPVLFAQSGKILLAKADGSPDKTLVDKAWAGAPAWSPDRVYVAYVVVYPADQRGTYVAKADGSGSPVKVSAYGLIETPPVWSPDGKQLAIREKAGTNQGIWVVNADGTGLTRVYDKNIADLAWSPDNLRIAYSYNERPTSGGVYTISVFGGGTPRLVAPLLRAGSLAYSPDGKRIAVRSQAAEGRRILSKVVGTGQFHVIDIEKGEIVQILAGLSGDQWRPAWINQHSIAIVLEGEGGQALAVINHTGDAVSVLAHGTQFQDISWSNDGAALHCSATTTEGVSPMRVILQDIGMAWNMDMDMTRSMKLEQASVLMGDKMMPWAPSMAMPMSGTPAVSSTPSAQGTPAAAPPPAPGIRMARLAFDKYT